MKWKETGLVGLILISACKKPTENLKVVIDTDIIKYTALINVTDAQTGNPIGDDAQLMLSGDHAAEVYEISGKKQIQLRGGMVAIGLHPDIVLEGNNTVTVTVEVNATGYREASRTVTFSAAEKQQVVDIALSDINSNAPPIVVPPPTVYSRAVSLNFTGKCPERSDLEIRPSVYVYFKETGTSRPFQYLGYMNKGSIKTNLLDLGRSYDFQMVYGGKIYRTSQKIEQDHYNLTVDMPGACDF